MFWKTILRHASEQTRLLRGTIIIEKHKRYFEHGKNLKEKKSYLIGTDCEIIFKIFKYKMFRYIKQQQQHEPRVI